MLKAHSTLFLCLRIVLDLIAATISWVAVYWLRFCTNLFPVEKGIPSFEAHLKFIAPVICLCYFASLSCGLYKPRRMANNLTSSIDILKASTISGLLVMAFFYYVQSGSPYSRLLVIYFALVQCLLTLITHLTMMKLLRIFRSKGYNLRHYVVIGSGTKAQQLINDFDQMRWTGMKCAYLIDNDPNLIGKSINNIPIKGPLEKLPELILDDPVDEVYLAATGNTAQRAYPVLEKLQLKGHRIRIIPDWGKLISLSKPETVKIGSQILFSTEDSPLSGHKILLKRIFDITASLLLLTVLSVPMLIIAIIIKATSKGPVFYKQKRIGIDNKPFDILKFRSMRIQLETKPGWTIEDDPRRTAIGSFLRATSLDELPQLFNVLKGEMSLVGPRPEQEYYVKEFSEEFRRYMLRHKVKTGMTGWAQINGLRGNTSIRKRLAYDLYYVKNWSFILDITILLRTPLEVLKGKNAY